jgi:acetoin:2,6-dichlorophenolindophenol oxidoreductase subunit alpha
MMEIAMRMPDLGTVDDTIKVVKWLVEVGQPIRRGQPIVEVETDKSILELESTATGKLKAIAVPAGSEAAAGEVIATFAVDAEPPSEPVATEVTKSVVATFEAAPAPADRPVSAPISAGHRLPSFEKNLRVPTESAPVPNAAVYSRDFLLDLYRRMVLIREFEEGVKFLFLEGKMPGTIHQCQGQEATAVGVCTALEPTDFITSTFRGHGHALAKGLSPEELLFELFGASTGCCGGKGGSMHVGDMGKGMVPGIAIVGGGIPLAAGMALALKMQKSSAVVACFFGDGAVAEGAFHEGVNLAAIWDLPVVFVCENNLYGASTRVDLVMRNPCVADRGAGYGIRGETVDGNDVLAVYQATRTAAAECRRGQGPVLLELLTYRRTGHSRRDACHYQAKDEREDWFARDPIERLGQVLIERGFAVAADLEHVRVETQRNFQATVELARRQPMPSVDDLIANVLA